MMKLLDFLEQDQTAKRNCVHQIQRTWNNHKEEYIAQLNGNCIIINNEAPKYNEKRETFLRVLRLGRGFSKEIVFEKIAEYWMSIHGASSENPKTWSTALKRMVAWDAMGEMMRFLQHAKLSVSNVTA